MSLKVYSCPRGCNRGATFARYVISANKSNETAAKVIVNGQSAGVLAFAPMIFITAVLDLFGVCFIINI